MLAFISSESRDISLGQYLDSTSVIWIPNDYFIPGFTPGRFYYLGFGYVCDSRYAFCFIALLDLIFTVA